MKHLFIALFVLLINELSAQNYKHNLSNDICDCFDKKKIKNTSQDAVFLDCYKENANKYKDSIGISYDDAIKYDPVRFKEAIASSEKHFEEIRVLLNDKCPSYSKLSEESKIADENFFEKLSDYVCDCAKKMPENTSYVDISRVCYKQYEAEHKDNVKLYISRRPNFNAQKINGYTLEILSKMTSVLMKQCTLFSEKSDPIKIKKKLTDQICNCVTAEAKNKNSVITAAEVQSKCIKEAINENEDILKEYFMMDKMVNINNPKYKNPAKKLITDSQIELLYNCDPFLKYFDESMSAILISRKNKISLNEIDSLDIKIKNKPEKDNYKNRGLKHLALGNFKKAEQDLLTVIKIAPNEKNIQTTFFLGWCYESQKKYKEAASLFQKVYNATNQDMYLLRLASAKSKMNKK